MYDIAIIGGGPAGATLAYLMGKKYKILLVDRRQLASSEEDQRVKSCGGLLAPDAQKIIASLGLGLPQNILTGPQLFTVRTIDLEESIERFYQRFYFNIDREKFDRWLISLIPSNVDTRFGCLFKSYEKVNDTFKLRLFQDGKEYTENAKIIVGADGASSLIRRRAFPNIPSPKRYIAIQEWFEVDGALPYFTAIFDKEITDFYSWIIPKEKNLVLGSALPLDGRANENFELFKKKLQNYGFDFEKRVRREGAFIYRPESSKQIFTGNGDIALVGEAAGWISPSSSEGISYALRSAINLSKSLNLGIEGFSQRYQRNSRELRSNIILKNLKSPVMYNSWLRKMVMNSGIESIKIIDDI